MTKETSVRHVRFPSEYGNPGESELRAWSEVEAKLRAALNYWLTTVGPNGLPHVRPVDGVWVDGTLCFGGSPETRWVRNLQANGAATVNLGSEEDAIILEGMVEQVSDPANPLAMASTLASFKKYPQYYPDGKSPEEPAVPFWAFRPKRAYAWTLTGFPRSATRWQF
jgi:general stress protein 26